MNAVADSSRLPIAIFISSFDIGGTERQMVELALRLDPHRFAVHLACFHASGALLSRCLAAGLPVAEFPIGGGFLRAGTWRQMRRFAAWCRANRIVILQTSDFYTNVFGLPAGALARIPVRLGGRRGLNVGKSAAHLALQRAAFSFAHAVVANSHAGCAQLRAERYPRRRIHLIPNGLQLPAPAARAARRVRRGIIVANLRPEKGHDVLVDAAAILRRADLDVEFLFVGEGGQRAAIEQRVAARGVESAVRLLGERDDVPALLAEADVFLLPSRSEAFPNAVLEAMAAGLPVITTAVGGLAEIVDHERTGLRVPVDDAAAIAEAMQRLIADPLLAARLGVNGRRFVEERFSFGRMIGHFEHLYEEMLARRAPRPLSPLGAPETNTYANSVGQSGKAAAG